MKKKTNIVEKFSLTIIFLLLVFLLIFNVISVATNTNISIQEYDIPTAFSQYESATVEREDPEIIHHSMGGQVKVQNLWVEQGKTIDENKWAYVTVGGTKYNIVAVATTFGKAGDFVDIYINGTTVYNCIMGDEKGEQTTNISYDGPFYYNGIFYGHKYGNECDVIEICIKNSDWPSSSFLKSLVPVTKIVNRGSIFDNPNGVGGTASISNVTSSANSKADIILQAISTLFSTVGDFIHRELSSLVDGNNMFNTKKITYARAEIEADENLNKQIKVKDAKDKEEFLSGTAKNIVKLLSMSNSVDDKHGVSQAVYTESTEIPVIPADLYSVALETTDLFDIDFLNPNYKTDNQNNVWKIIRDFVIIFSRILMYISAAALLTLLIYRAILLVSSTFGDDPAEAAESRKIMDDWVKAIVLIAGTVLFIALTTHFYETLKNIILDGNTNKYIIRLNVENVYTFNTNLTGYVKYVSLTTNSLAKLGYSIIYLILAIFNFVLFIVMFFRMLFIGLLIIIAPVISITAMLRKTVMKDGFKRWMKTYIKLLIIPLVFIIIYRGILLLM